MKSLIHIFLLLNILHLFGACSKAAPSKTLNVTSSFELGPGGYTGGLVVQGSSSTGEKFTATTVGGSSLDVSIKDGTWSFVVTGWDGNDPFTGAAHCGLLTTELTSATTSISVTVNPANCHTAAFNNGLNNLTDNTYGFRLTDIFTCRSQYNDSGLVGITAATSNSSFLNYCTGPADFSKYARGIKIKIPGTPALATSCIQTTGPKFESPLRLPTSKVPLEISLFPNKECIGMPVVYSFMNGLLAGVPETDSLVNNMNASSTYNLFMPFNQMKRGYSPFWSILPKFDCGYECFLQPPGLLPLDYHIWASTEFQPIKVLDGMGYTCAAVANPVSTGTVVLNIPSGFCKEKDGDVFLLVAEPTMGACSTPGDCTLSVDLNGDMHELTISSDNTISTDKNLYDAIWRLTGNNQDPSYNFNYFNEESTKKFGLLSHAREMMGPGGPASLFGTPTSNCDNVVFGTKRMTVWKDLQYRNYEFEIKASSKVVPR